MLSSSPNIYRIFSKVLLLLFALALGSTSPAQQATNVKEPIVQKVEPPNWWVNLTPEVMLLLTGKNLRATHVNCNLQDVSVSRTQSSANGDYLFVWLKVAATLKSGTAICRITTADGQASFEIPFAARKQILGRNQGLSLDDVIYLLMPDRFANGDLTNDEPAESPGSHDRANPRAYHGGDLRGILQHLPYLKDLGVTTLWLTPILKNGATEDYHGYGAVDLYAVDPHLGSLADYQELIAAAHKQHMKVLHDVVPNHVGPRHPWVKDPPTPDWFHGSSGQHMSSSMPIKRDFYGQQPAKKATNDLFEALVDPHTPEEFRKNLTEGWFFNILPDLNTENPLVAEYLIQNSIWWAEVTGLDGYRIDTFPYVGRAFWSQWHQETRKSYPRLSTIGEVFHPDPTVTSFFVGGRKGWDGIDTQLTTVFDFPSYFAMRDVLLDGAQAGRLTNVLRQDSLYPHPEYLVPFFGNHDTLRFASAPGATLTKEELAFALTLTLRGIPEIYYGDEIGMAGGEDPDNRRDFPGGWAEDPKNAFSPEGRTANQEKLFEYVQGLLRLRREHDSLRVGKLWHLASDDTSYIFLRESEEEKVVVAFHIGANARTMNVALTDTPAKGTSGISPIFGSAQAELAGDVLKFTLPPQSLSIFVLQ